jgi:hypothetical protein
MISKQKKTKRKTGEKLIDSTYKEGAAAESK